MDQPVAPASGSNPFSTRFVRPGALVYRFSTTETLGELAQKFIRQELRGAIVGPHGSGKSTLLSALLTELANQGRQAERFSLQDGQRKLPHDWRAMAGRPGVAFLAVDGYEQLSRWSRWRLDSFCRGRQLGLLITAHAPTSLATLHRTTPSVALVETLAAALVGEEFDDAYRARIAVGFARMRGDVREVLFDLYDFYEARRVIGRRTGD